MQCAPMEREALPHPLIIGEVIRSKQVYDHDHIIASVEGSQLSKVFQFAVLFPCYPECSSCDTGWTKASASEWDSFFQTHDWDPAR